MKKILVSLLLVSILSVGNASESPFGLWQFSGTAVYVEILESGETFQCRIALDKSVITAKGTLIGTTSINWEPLSIVDINGNPVDSQGFSWGTDSIAIENGKLTLAGPYGNFEYKKCCSSLPKECR